MEVEKGAKRGHKSSKALEKPQMADRKRGKIGPAASIYSDTVLGKYFRKIWPLLTRGEQANIKAAVEQELVRSVATMCSGSGSGEIAHHAFLNMMGKESEVFFTCECVAWKQQHLLKVGQLIYLPS